MGYNTTIFVLNDHMEDIKRNPQKFVEELASGIGRSHSQMGPVDIFAQTTVMPTQHADVSRLYYTHGNSIIDLSYPWSDAKKRLSGVDNKHIKEYYKNAIKDAKRTLREWEKNLKEIDEEESK